uniref:G-protein coupled receptors family 1 profile domain-containing protein n=1 Tax=Parascaris univalens TaxID=6257 RepID=A0A915AFR5_PARUN
TNGISAFIIFKMDHLRNAFGYSCASHAFGNLGVLLIFAFWAAPLLILKYHTMKLITGYKFIANAAGQLTIVFYYAGIYTNILITINRCFVITWPILYQKYFNTTMTIRWIAIIWLIAFTQSCIYQFRKWFFYRIVSFICR